MTRLTIDLPTTLHKTIKSLSIIEGDSMKNIAIKSIQKYAKSKILKNKINTITKAQATKKLKPVADKLILKMKNGDISVDEFDKKFNLIKDYVTEDEIDRLLSPYLEKIIVDIENDNSDLVSLNELLDELED
jgi:hypothetical protein